MAARYLIILALLVGCSSRPAGYSVDPALRAVVEEWKRDVRQAGVNPDRALARLKVIRIEILPGDWAGLTNRSAGSVTIDPIQLRRGPYSTRHTLYHELGHFAFRLEHGDCLMMEGSGLPEKHYRTYWKEMRREYLEEIKRCTNTSYSRR